MRTKDIKPLRDKMLLDQGGVDPIVRQPIIDPVCDHSHDTGHIRSVLDRDINRWIGFIENNFQRFVKYRYPEADISEALRQVADYLAHDFTHHPLHPKHISACIRRFSRLTLADQRRVLTGIGEPFEFEMRKKELTGIYRRRIDP